MREAFVGQLTQLPCTDFSPHYDRHCRVAPAAVCVFVWPHQRQALRFLASRAESLLREIPIERVGSFDLLSIGHAFAQVSDVHRATGYFDKAETAASGDLRDLVTVHDVRAAFFFNTANPARGRAESHKAVAVAEKWREQDGDVALDAALLTALRWAWAEHTVPDVAQRDAVLELAESSVMSFVGEWRRRRGREQIANARSSYAAPAPRRPGRALDHSA